MLDKENKTKQYEFYTSLQTKKNINDRQTQVYYEILALKMLLKDENPDPMTTNQVCESIKQNL